MVAHCSTSREPHSVEHKQASAARTYPSRNLKGGISGITLASQDLHSQLQHGFSATWEQDMSSSHCLGLSEGLCDHCQLFGKGQRQPKLSIQAESKLWVSSLPTLGPQRNCQCGELSLV